MPPPQMSMQSMQADMAMAQPKMAMLDEIEDRGMDLKMERNRGA